MKSSGELSRIIGRTKKALEDLKAPLNADSIVKCSNAMKEAESERERRIREYEGKREYGGCNEGFSVVKFFKGEQKMTACLLDSFLDG